MNLDGRAGEYASFYELDEEYDHLDCGKAVGDPWSLEGEEWCFATPW